MVCWMLGAPGADLRAQLDVPPRGNGGLYGSFGVGFINLEKGFGLSIPLGLTVIAARHRLVGAANLLDLGLLQGDDRNPRYVRTYYRGSRSPGCVDTKTRYLVSSFRCSAGTDALHSFSADLSYIPVESLWIGGRPGLLFTGLGYRFLNPRTPYGTVGMYFDSRSRMRGGFKIAFGKNYAFFGLIWGYRARGP